AEDGRKHHGQARARSPAAHDRGSPDIQGLRARRDGQPSDLGVHFSGKVVEKQSVLMVGRPGPYDYGWGRRELGGYDTLDYREGTLYLDLVEVASNRLVWRTGITEALSAGYSEENWKKIEQALEKAFEGVPQRR
ncbi:MAG TPA: DUF4136 domain-containing protein, partial [Burkholderiales bacterium]|nr:DUF4136 domain-containing protein [Burkholderiales bacterium]